ncbi:dihydrofolate reductase [Candidatus Uhrbacteria bacterium]|nr:dihydrofolate reductase [Candidatus Uhrbacteria bacterium]
MMNVWLIAAMSVDGKIAQSSEQVSLDWTSKEDTRFFIDKTKEAGVVIMGRKTFDTIGKPLPGRRMIVMTRQTDLAFEGDGVEYSTLSPSALLEQLSHEGVQTVALAGGEMVYSQFLQAGLVTDVYLTIEPILFGSGIPLATGFERIEMRLEDVVRINDQAVLLHYKL